MQTVKNKRNVLVIVGHDAEPPILVDALRPRSEGTGFTLLVPATSLHGPNSETDWADALDRAERNTETIRDGRARGDRDDRRRRRLRRRRRGRPALA